MVTFMCRNLSIYLDNNESLSSEVSEREDNDSRTESESVDSGTESESVDSGTESESENFESVSGNKEKSKSNIDESGDTQTSEQIEQTEQEETYITYFTSVSSNGNTENIDKSVIDVLLLGSVIGVLLSLVLFNRIKAC